MNQLTEEMNEIWNAFLGEKVKSELLVKKTKLDSYPEYQISNAPVPDLVPNKEDYVYIFKNDKNVDKFKEVLGYGVDEIEKVGIEKFIRTMGWTNPTQVKSWITDALKVGPCISCGENFGTEDTIFTCQLCAPKFHTAIVNFLNLFFDAVQSEEERLNAQVLFIGNKSFRNLFGRNDDLDYKDHHCVGYMVQYLQHYKINYGSNFMGKEEFKRIIRSTKGDNFNKNKPKKSLLWDTIPKFSILFEEIFEKNKENFVSQKEANGSVVYQYLSVFDVFLAEYAGMIFELYELSMEENNDNINGDTVCNDGRPEDGSI